MSDLRLTATRTGGLYHYSRPGSRRTLCGTKAVATLTNPYHIEATCGRCRAADTGPQH